jgi:hypothetical protein
LAKSVLVIVTRFLAALLSEEVEIIVSGVVAYGSTPKIFVKAPAANNIVKPNCYDQNNKTLIRNST